MGVITKDTLQAFLGRQRRLLAALTAGMALAAEAHGIRVKKIGVRARFESTPAASRPFVGHA